MAECSCHIFEQDDDRAMVKAYLTQLIDDIGGFIKQLDREAEGVKGKSKEYMSAGKRATASTQRATHHRGKTESEEQRPRWK